MMHRRRRQEVLGRPLRGKRTKSRMHTYHRFAHNPRARCFRPRCSSDSNLLTYGQNFLNMHCWARTFNARQTHPILSLNTHKYIFCELFLFPHYSGKAAPHRRSAKQHQSNSAHLMRRFVRGLSIYVYQFFIPTDFRA
jgi:hypothetical protein